MILANPPTAGDLLISGSGLTTGIFAHSVIYLLDCDEDGALGVVINQPSQLDMAQILPHRSHRWERPDRLGRCTAAGS